MNGSPEKPVSERYREGLLGDCITQLRFRVIFVNVFGNNCQK